MADLHLLSQSGSKYNYLIRYLLEIHFRSVAGGVGQSINNSFLPLCFGLMVTGGTGVPESPDDLSEGLSPWLLGLRILLGEGPLLSPIPPAESCEVFMLALAAVLRGLDLGLDDTCSEMKAYIRSWVSSCAPIYAHKNARQESCEKQYRRKRVHTHTHTHTHARSRTHTHTHTHTHTQLAVAVLFVSYPKSNDKHFKRTTVKML